MVYLPAHLANLLIYIQRLELLPKPSEVQNDQSIFFHYLIKKRGKIHLFASLLPVDRMYTKVN